MLPLFPAVSALQVYQIPACIIDVFKVTDDFKITFCSC